LANSISALALLVVSQHLRAFDLALIAVYLIGITLFGLRFRKKPGTGAPADRSLRSYFLANNTIPWWAISLSIVSAETSTLTIISVPGVAFAGNFGFLQIVIGYMIGRIVVAMLFLPRYFAGEMLTAYQLIDRRFGPVLHKVTAGLFLLTRAAAEGVRLFAVSIIVGIAIGTRDVLSIGIISLLTLLYTFEGGMAAVIWTDVVQMAIYIGGTFVAIATLGSHVSGGWTQIHTVASAAGKFHMLNFAFNLTTTYTFWAGVLGGTFLTMASHGTDQLMVQRMLAARNLRESRLALLSSGVVIFIQFSLFLLIGAGLYVFYGQHPAVFSSADRIFPTFIVREMPIGIAGLLVAAILAAAMSNLSAALNSLSSTTVVDFYMHLRPSADNRERAIISKSSTVLWALVLFAIAVYSLAVGGKGHVVEIGLSIASVAYGCLLGVFLLGTLTRFATQTGATIGMVFGFILNLWLWQGVFPVHLGPITIPHIAWTWYVLIGAIVTFGIGSIASLIFGKQFRRRAIAAAVLPLLFCLSFRGVAQEPASPAAIAPTQAPAPTPDFTPVSTLINDAIAAHKLPGAVVLIGHNRNIVFKQAYGDRKLADEPGLDGKPSPAESMTEDTIFDMASLSKCLSTAAAIMQLYERGKLNFDDPIEKYLPAFNPTHDPERAQVTIRMLLTHTSGEAPDIDLKDAWGLAKPNKAEGIHRALTTPLQSTPGEVFRYSDVNFILLGDLVKTLSGQPLDVYAQQHIFKPLGMTETRYLPVVKACGPHHVIGAAIAWAPKPRGRMAYACAPGTWSTSLLQRIAPEAHDNEGTAATNPDFDHLLRGTVHDPTTRRMGGVAGHAGVFSTAHDVSLFAQALLDRLAGRPSNFPLKQSTLELMTTPEQPGHDPGQLPAANAAEQAAMAAPTSEDEPAAPGLAPHYPAIKGQDLHGFGWDIDTAFSKPRGMIFPIGSFGHTGFTGTSLWMDPASDTYVILLANAIHPRGNRPISNLRGEVATAAAEALQLYGSAPDSGAPSSPGGLIAGQAGVPGERSLLAGVERGLLSEARPFPPALTGLDVLEQTHFAALAEAADHHNRHLALGLLTNQTGLDAHSRRTIDILAIDLPKSVPTAHLTTLFSPEHGIFGKQDSTSFAAETDPTTGLHVTSLYGPHDADKRPSHEQLKDLDAVVIDLQDAGVRFYTYETLTGYFLEAAAREQTEYHHDLEIILLDRPDLIGGEQVQGPVSDPGLESYTDYMPLPVRHGLTLGELARYIDGTKHLDAHLTVIPMQHWSRTEYFDATGLPWTNPSPNLRNLTAATLYPGLGFLDFANISVGRGTSTPFELFGAAWLHAADVADALTARHIPGVTFAATTTTVAEDANHYPFHGQTIDAVRITLTDRTLLDSPELGIEILSVLHHLYPTEFQLDKTLRLIANRATLDALQRGDDPRNISFSWTTALDQFQSARTPYLLYK
jgi:SSS family transporter